jgi:mannosyltransferase OCH1-like enzyme
MSNIPKKIVQTWENKNIEDEFQEKFINSWKNKNPDYDYYLFDKEERNEFIQKHFNNIIFDTYNNIIPGAYKADFFRYCYLYICGGITTDIDTLCIGKLNDFLLPNIDFLTTIDFNNNIYEGNHNLAGGTIIASIPKHPILLNCINKIVYNIRNNVSLNGRLDFTGPGILGRAVNKFIGNEETTSFIGKEGLYYNWKIHLLKFEKTTEYFKDMNGNILGQNKCGNEELRKLYINECKKIKNYVSWTECPTENFYYTPLERKNIALLIYGQFRSYKNNLINNIKNMEPILKTHNIHIFVLTDKKEYGNYSKDNENEIKKIFTEHFFNINVFTYVEDYDDTEEIETVNGFLNNIKHKKGMENEFVPKLIYRKYLLNKIKNEYIKSNNINIDLTIYCRIFDIIIKNNVSFDKIENEVNNLYCNKNILLGSSDCFFIGSNIAMEYLLNLSLLFKNGKFYSDSIWEDNNCCNFISSMDFSCYNHKAIYSPEIQYLAHMFYSNYTYKNIRVDFTNPSSILNKDFLYHVLLDPRRK